MNINFTDMIQIASKFVKVEVPLSEKEFVGKNFRISSYFTAKEYEKIP